MRSKLSLLLTLLLICSLLPKRASGLELYTSEDESYRIEFRGYIKSFSLIIGGNERFLPETPPNELKQLDKLFQLMGYRKKDNDLNREWDEFRREMAILAVQQLWFRMGFRFKLGENAALVIDYELRPTIGSDPQRLLGKLPVLGTGLSQGMGGQNTDSFGQFSPFTSFDDRYLDFPPTIYRNQSFQLNHYLDRLYFSYSFPFADLTVGRQPISFGVGRLFRPTDIFAPFSPQELDTEQRRGVDAIRLDFPLGETSELNLVGAVQRLEPSKEREPGTPTYFEGFSPAGAIRAKWNLWGWDFSLLAGYIYRDLIAGIGLSGSISKLGLQAEFLYRYPIVRPEKEHPGGLWSLSFNLEYKFDQPDLLLELSYYHQSVGTGKPEQYLATANSPRYKRGEAFLLGTDYLALFALWKAHPLLSIQSFLILNLRDPSLLLGPILELSLAQDLTLQAGIYAGIGAPPKSQYKGGKIEVQLQSEFGALAAIGILSLKYYY